MFITESEALDRLNHENNLLNLIKAADNVNRGRGRGTKNVHPIVREVAGTLAHFDKQKNVARQFGLKENTVAEYSRGEIGGQGQTKKDSALKERIQQNLEIVRDAALAKLMQTLELMDDEKLENLPAEKLSNVAANLSRIVDKTGPKESVNIDQSTKVLVYKPRQSSEDEYEVIDAVCSEDD